MVLALALALALVFPPHIVILLRDNGIHALNKAFILLPHRKMWAYRMINKIMLAVPLSFVGNQENIYLYACL